MGRVTIVAKMANHPRSANPWTLADDRGDRRHRSLNERETHPANDRHRPGLRVLPTAGGLPDRMPAPLRPEDFDVWLNGTLCVDVFWPGQTNGKSSNMSVVTSL
jgi:hypothetical protein